MFTLTHCTVQIAQNSYSYRNSYCDITMISPSIASVQKHSLQTNTE